jgi:hypothetical protein
MYEAHKLSQVTDEDFDKFKGHMLSMMKDRNHSPHIIEFLLNKIEEQRKVIVIPPA